MQKITVQQFLSTNLRPEFNAINSLEIDDKPFSEGAFGAVYFCHSVNSIVPYTSQVIKIFKETFPGSMDHNAKTIERLQKKIFDLNTALTKNNKTVLDEFPAFKGIPQFSFRGTLNGKQVSGFSADNLVNLGFKDFEKVLEDPYELNKFHSIPLEKKFSFALQLVSAFKILADFKFIHADLKPAAIFVNMSSCECAIIDYDSGVITENKNDEPNTWGAPGDWVAPEVWKQLSVAKRGDKIQVDLFTDRWSVAIGIHYLLSTIHPLFFLSELSPRVSNQYFSSTKWPNADKNAVYFNKDNEAFYDQYFQWISNDIPAKVREKIAQTINYGYRDPTKRTSYSEWKIALESVQEPPKINFFKPDKPIVIAGLPVILSWDIERAHTIVIDNGIGDVTGKTEIKVRPSKDTTYTIKAIGYFGQDEITVDVAIFPTPLMESLIVPTPQFDHRISFSPLNIQSPVLKIEFDSSNLSQAPTMYIGLEQEIEDAKPLFKKKQSFFNISDVFDKIKAKLSDE